MAIALLKASTEMITIGTQMGESTSAKKRTTGSHSGSVTIASGTPTHKKHMRHPPSGSAATASATPHVGADASRARTSSSDSDRFDAALGGSMDLYGFGVFSGVVGGCGEWIPSDCIAEEYSV